MSARSQARRASRQDKASRRWPKNEKAQTRGTTGNLGSEVTDKKLKCRRDRPQQGPTT